MTLYGPLNDRVRQCEEDLARLVGACLAHGELSESETRQLRLVTSELLALSRDIVDRKAELRRLTRAIRRLAPEPTLH